jgi:hypothetical protein
MCMNTSENNPKRWTIYADPALIEQFRQLAAWHKRSLNSELIWALEQYAKQEQRKAKRETSS